MSTVWINVACGYNLSLSIAKSFSGEEVGFLICFDVEHSCLAHAYELLRQDCECYCSEVSEETAGQRGSCINKLVSICDT